MSLIYLFQQSQQTSLQKDITLITTQSNKNWTKGVVQKEVLLQILQENIIKSKFIVANRIFNGLGRMSKELFDRSIRQHLKSLLLFNNYTQSTYRNTVNTDQSLMFQSLNAHCPHQGKLENLGKFLKRVLKQVFNIDSDPKQFKSTALPFGRQNYIYVIDLINSVEWRYD